MVGGENLILTKEEIRKLLEIQSKLEDQQVWITTAQAGFPTTPVEDEIHTTQDLQLGRPTARHLHPEISAFIGRKHDDILSQNRSPSATELKLLELEREWGTGDIGTDTDEEIREMETQDHILWEPNPPPLMTNHPPRITSSNTKIQLRKGTLDQPCPKGEDDLGWVQIQQKSLMWEEKNGDFSVITHEGLTTLAHSVKISGIPGRV